MHDFSLGSPVDLGEYAGPLLNGNPIHQGNCEDGVYGCRKCNRASRELTDEELKEIGFKNTQECDWCHKEVHISKINGCRPWDESGQVYYEICDECDKKYQDDLNRELKELEDFDEDPPEEW